MQDCVSAYSEALNLHWTREFGEGYFIILYNSIIKNQSKTNTLKTLINSNVKTVTYLKLTYKKLDGNQ